MLSLATWTDILALSLASVSPSNSLPIYVNYSIIFHAIYLVGPMNEIFNLWYNSKFTFGDHLWEEVVPCHVVVIFIMKMSAGFFS